MTKVICTKKKDSFKNLTVNKEYEAIDNGESYVIQNDAGFRTAYAKHYFAIHENRNFENIATVNISNTDANIIRIEVGGFGRGIAGINNELIINRAHNSCGIQEVEGIGALKQLCGALSERLRNVNNASGEQIFTYIIERLMTFIKEHYSGAFITFSTYLSLPNNEEGMLAEYNKYNCISSREDCILATHHLNTNTNHIIGLWIIRI